jgi:hypothetical protein
VCNITEPVIRILMVHIVFIRLTAGTSSIAPNITGSPTGVLFEDDIVETVTVPSVEPKMIQNHPKSTGDKLCREMLSCLYIYMRLQCMELI